MRALSSQKYIRRSDSTKAADFRGVRVGEATAGYCHVGSHVLGAALAAGWLDEEGFEGTAGYGVVGEADG